MISEPEIAEGADLLESHDIVGDVVQRDAGPRTRRKPWLWALAGAAAASALWSAALLPGFAHHGPDARGYRLDGYHCTTARMPALEKQIAPRETTGAADTEHLKDAAVDQLHCSVQLQTAGNDRPGGHWAVNHTIGIGVVLHKKTDPGLEFAADQRVTDLGVVAAGAVRTVSGLGDKAVMIAKDSGHWELRVLDGAVVLSLSLSATNYYESAGEADEIGEAPELPDMSTYGPAMIADMRELMSSLKH